ncbi:AAA family ATPase [Terrisporobacter sp.]|uniref:AAA family ATPase n=1 Tax=Terrisporobacter sp. TaxID=1965305 RepID=UPI00262FB11B|nr:AAA family ATPase [Terrisporobacter sp.]
MGYLAIRKVIYQGDNYTFESPVINDGIIIIEGDNEHGKSTFMDLIYYALGGKVLEFYQKDKTCDSKHIEIYNDTNNFVELHVEINGEEYELIRTFNKNIIYIIDSDKNVTESQIYRGNNTNDTIFSDWILEKLGIEVFDIIQGTKQFKLGFNDLMRLIYHDQKTEVDKIYKNPQNENFVSDSLQIRNAIFEVLMGEVYNEYYYLLGKYKLKMKEYDDSVASIKTFNELLREITSDELENINYIDENIRIKENNLRNLEIERKIARTTINNPRENIEDIELNKNKILILQDQIYEVNKRKKSIEESIDKIIVLIENTEKEIEEINKIRFVNKKLNLFSPNTCPYCLNTVEREENKCICGNTIEEEEYEKFFYSNEEYLEIIHLKNKYRQSLNSILEKKKDRLDSTKEEILILKNEVENLKEYINDLAIDTNSTYGSAYVRKIDDKIKDIRQEISSLEQYRELALKKEELLTNSTNLRKELEDLKIDVNDKHNSAQKDINIKRFKFNEIYNELMKRADKYCYEAYINDIYMPIVNDKSYRARSASVPKRLMYFLTLLIMSLKYNTNYPRFLMIDTPNKEGIDIDRLKIILEQLNEVNKYIENNDVKFQIILTTGINIYPESLKQNILLTMKDEDKLLKIKGKNKK